MKMNLLFLCTEGLDRSPTAARLFLNNLNYEPRSAGILNAADPRVLIKDINWADYIFVMEKKHENYLLEIFPEANKKRLRVLEIMDIYHAEDPNLITILKSRLKGYLNDLNF